MVLTLPLTLQEEWRRCQVMCRRRKWFAKRLQKLSADIIKAKNAEDEKQRIAIAERIRKRKKRKYAIAEWKRSRRVILNEKLTKSLEMISELNLDNCRSTSIVGLTDEYTALESLSLINVGLTTLKGFPKLPNLKRLELSDNRISNGLNYLTTSPKLAYLNLSGNKIKDLEALKPLEAFENLAVLDLFNNEATQIENYREKIFEMLPSLEFLDGFDANDVEAPSEGDDDDEVNGNDSEDEVSDEMGDDEDDGEDGDDDDEDESDDEDNADVSLAEVYNDDLEEDNSDWEEAGDDGDDDESDEEDGDGEAAAETSADKDKEAETAEEPQARGKKRKHDG